MVFMKDLGIDLGTANTLVVEPGKGIIINEPSVVAIDTDSKKVLAVGNEAKKMIGRTPGNIVAIRPMQDGVIADYEITQAMLKYFINSSTLKGWFVAKPRVVVCIPSGVTEVEKRAVRHAATAGGARDKNAFLIEEPMAAAIGAGLPVEEATGSMVVDIGGGTSEVAVISLGGIVTSKSLRVAGDEFDRHIVHYIKKEYNLAIGERTAEEIKVVIGSVYQLEEEKSMDIKGRDLISGLPKTVNVSSKEIRDSLHEPVYAIVDAIKITLEKTPPELSSDIIESGIMLTGGGALLNGMDQLISYETGIPVHIAKDPLSCVAIGTGMVLEHIDTLKSVLLQQSKIRA